MPYYIQSNNHKYIEKDKESLSDPAEFIQSTKSLMEHLMPSVHKVGVPPGTLTYTGAATGPTKIRLFQYNKEEIIIHEKEDVSSISKKLSNSKVNWIDVVGFEDINKIRELGALFQIDQLTLEDLLNTGQLPKIEEREDYQYITLKLVNVLSEENMFSFTHYSLIIKGNVLITFSEKPNTIFKNIEDRLQNNVSALRNSSTNYLSYRIIDTIVDNYYLDLEWFTNILSNLETELVENPSKTHIHVILTFKKQWLVLRKAIFPFKESLRRVSRLESDFMHSAGKYYIQDLNDHLQSISETMEILRESLNNLMDLYSSTLSNKMNEVMKMLTIVSTIFIPLTFIAGVYGMNFQNMPELSWKNGYFYTLGIMVLVGITTVLFMIRRKWL